MTVTSARMSAGIGAREMVISKVVVGFAGLLSLLSGLAFAQDPPDLVSYIEKIRAQGITDSGKSQIMTVVVIRLGQSTLTFDEDTQTGRYTPTFQSATCPVPGADPVKAAEWQAELARARDAEFGALKPLSDTDGSGFVSSEEAMAFRSAFEFGSLAQCVVEKSGFSRAALCRASGLDEATVDTRLSFLDELGKRMVAAGLKPFPAVGRE
jgi:hypothetical protein